jgi:hypothetical protein
VHRVGEGTRDIQPAYLILSANFAFQPRDVKKIPRFAWFLDLRKISKKEDTPSFVRQFPAHSPFQVKHD